MSLRFATISRKQPTLVISWPSGERITVRKMPPGRRSISQSTVFHGAGVNHFLMCSGLVHAAHTSSGDVDHALQNEIEPRIVLDGSGHFVSSFSCSKYVSS